MKSNKKVVNKIYGDEDQKEYELLMQREPEINKLVDTATAKALKKRARYYKKHRKMKDTSLNSAKASNAALKDLDDTTFDMSIDDPTNEAEQKPVDEKTPKEPKKKKSRGLLIVLLLLTIALVGYLGIQYINTLPTSIDPSGTPATVDPTTTEVAEPSPTPVVEITEVNGKLAEFDSTHEYTVEETLEISNSINQAILDYYSEYIEIVKNNDIAVIQSKSDEYQRMIREDIDTLNMYMDVYMQSQGDYYLQTAIQRYQNFEMFMNEMMGMTDQQEMAECMMNYVQRENFLCQESKDALIEYLSANGIEYEDNGDFVVFDISSFEMDPLEDLAATDAPVDAETPVDTEAPTETVAAETPVDTETPTDTGTSEPTATPVATDPNGSVPSVSVQPVEQI